MAVRPVGEAARYRLPVVEPRPWDTLAERILKQAA